MRSKSNGHFQLAPESAIPLCDLNFGLNVCVFDLFLQNVCLVCACHSAACICTQASCTPEGLYCFPHYLTGKSLYIGQQSPVAVPCSRQDNSAIGVYMDRYLVVVSAASLDGLQLSDVQHFVQFLFRGPGRHRRGIVQRTIDHVVVLFGRQCHGPQWVILGIFPLKCLPASFGAI